MAEAIKKLDDEKNEMSGSIRMTEANTQLSLSDRLRQRAIQNMQRDNLIQQELE